jgi:YD repeat-containing protein
MDAASELTSTTDANSHTTTFAYNADGQRTTVTDALGHVSTTVYDNLGRVSAQVNALGNATTFTYDAVGRQLTIEDARGNFTTMSYDKGGNLVTTENALGNTSTFVFDGINQRTAVEDATSHFTTTTYDADGEIVAVTNPLSHTTTYVYDNDGRQTAVENALGNFTTTTYDAGGNILTVKDSDNNVTTFAYNSLNEITTETYPNGSTATFAYNSIGLETSTTDQDGRVRNFSYDADKRETGETWYNSSGTLTQTLTFSYDSVGNMLTAANGNGSYTLTYDSLNRVSTVQEPFGLSLTFTYDQVGNRTVVQDSFGGLTTYAYDANNNLTSVSFGGATPMLIQLVYNAVNQITTEQRYNNLTGTGSIGTTSDGYDADGRLTSISNTDGGTTLSSYTYTYDSAGELTSENDNSSLQTYTYSSFAATKGRNRTALSHHGIKNSPNLSEVSDNTRQEQRREVFCRQTRRENQRRSRMFRPSDYPRSFADGGAGLLFDLAVLQAHRVEPEGAASGLAELQGCGAGFGGELEEIRPRHGRGRWPAVPASADARSKDGGQRPHVGRSGRHHRWAGVRLFQAGDVPDISGAVWRGWSKGRPRSACLPGAVLLFHGSGIRPDPREASDMVSVHRAGLRQRSRMVGAEAAAKRDRVRESGQRLRQASRRGESAAVCVAVLAA